MFSEQALRGAIVGLTYGVVERFFASALPWLLKPSYVYQPPNRAAVIALLLIYAIAGALIQLLVAAALRRARPEMTDIVVRLMVIAVFAASFVFEYLPPYLFRNRTLYAIALGGQVVALVAAVVIGYIATGRVLGMVALSALLILPWYMIIDRFAQRHVIFNAIVVSLAILVVAFAGWMLQARLPRRIANAAGVIGAVVIIAVALLAPQTVDSSPPPRATRPQERLPNVVIITLDTVRADHLSPYGYGVPTAPNLARFASQATLFTRAFSSGDMTLSTHASMFTGLEPRSHGAHYKRDASIQPLGRSMPTMGEILSARGYDTIAVVANSAFLSHAFGLNRGFRYYDERVDPPFLAQMSEYFVGRGVIDLIRRSLWPLGRFVSVRTAETINRDVRAALQSRGRRFLLFVNYIDAHWPYDSPGSAQDSEPDRYLRYVLAKDAPPEYCRVLVSRYDAAITSMDEEVGKLLDDLRARGLYDDALIIITSDHGEAFGEHRQLSHGMSVYQNQIHVPLVVKAPRQTAAAVVTTAVSSTDIFDTVLAACHVKPLPSDAVDLTLVGSVRREVLSEHFGVIDADQVAITDGTMKLIRDAAGSAALYDLDADALEQSNVFFDSLHAARAMELTRSLETHLARAEREKQKVDRASVGDENFLRALGYLR